MNRSRLAWILSCCWHWPQYISMSGIAIIFNNLFDLHLNHYRRTSQCWHLKDSLEVSGWLHFWFWLLERDSVWCGRILSLAVDCSRTSGKGGHSREEASALLCWCQDWDSVCPDTVSFSSQWTSWWLMRRSQHAAMAVTERSVWLVTLASQRLESEKIKKILFIIFLQKTNNCCGH